MSIPELISRHSYVTYYYHERLESFLRQLRDAHFEEYRHLPPDPKFREQALALTPVVLDGVKWDGHAGEVVTPDGYLQFNLDRSRFVCGLRIRIACSDPRNMSPVFRVKWAQDDGSEVGSYSYYEIPASGEEVELTIFLYKNIKSFKVYPNNRPSGFRISGVSVLFPEHD